MNSFTFYKEYSELISLLPVKEQQELIYEIVHYMIYDKDPELNDRQNKIFINLKRALDVSKNNSKRSKGNGAPTGNNNASKNKPKTNQKQTKNKPEDKPKTNTSNDVYVNVNVKSNKRDNRGMGEEEEKEKKHFAEFVTMTNVEYEKLINTYGEEFTKRCIETLDNYKGSSGKKYKSDYRAILNWVIEKVETSKPQKTNKPSWMGKEYAENTATNEEIEELLKTIGGEKNEI